MRILVNGVRLYFDVEGAQLRPQGDAMQRRPTLLLLHGGPGADHSLYKPAFSQLADIAQVVYVDHRGNGRSDRSTPDTWTLDQWADDVHAFCQALEIEKPIVYGSSFGGIVAMAYAIRYPQHPGKLALVSTTAQARSHTAAKVAMFQRLGGNEAGALAQRRFVDGDTSPGVLARWLELALPLYTQSPHDAAATARLAFNRECTAWFNRVGGEGRDFDFLADLGRISCPTLVLAGALDPMLPVECQRDVAAALRSDVVQYREFAHCGHGVVPDAPDEAMAVIREFIQKP